ncbi:mannose-specific lectin [Amborella trichopoda]|uniref:Bulb-type lectin domain-containing protein n=1 Tax=Amborella trichopoda TaxID=13333 RepID=W1PNL2_AMBTC|nr:mannose-specific lectin [Amborella trichopoda]ERN09394.1 hypothetical protein AMTR_s00029p00039560 [Amborella trichopoda]|eukprot:XP_006847813.1 mannose-specific lectin [Amborella trichopoda]
MGALTLVIAMVMALSLATLSNGEDTMFNGEKLLANQFLENDPYKFIMQSDCNLVLYKKQSNNNNKALWASGTNGHGSSCTLLLQNSGNLVISDGSDAIWTSKSSRGPNTYRLVVQDDGNVVTYGGATWATNTVQSSKKRSFTSIVKNATVTFP